MFKVTIIVGSLSKRSINKKLARALEKLGNDLFTCSTVCLDEVPFFNQDIETTPPAAVTAMHTNVIEADAVLFVTPEYNRSVPAPLKNALDWLSRPYGKNRLAGKPVAIAGMSVGAIGTACAQNHLRAILQVLNARTMPQPDVYLGGNANLIDDNDIITNESSQAFLRKFLESFNDWITIQK